MKKYDFAMKHIFLLLIIICSGFTLFAQSPFSVKFELVNPSGKVDADSYFSFTLINNTDSSYFIMRGAQNIGCAIHTYLVQETQYRTHLAQGYSIPSFDFGDKKVILLKPRERISVSLPIFVQPDGIGVLPYRKKILVTVEKVRYILAKLRYINDDNPLPEMKTIDLVSNWVEIDAAVFARLLEGAD